MRLHARDMLVRCAQRGYTWDEIEPCLRADLGGGWYDVDVEHPAYPRTAKPKAATPMGLGDMVAAGLSAIGITKERVSKAVGGDCGCAARQQAMNEWGKKHLGIG